jgi:uncharacterized integral membrane protein
VASSPAGEPGPGTGTPAPASAGGRSAFGRLLGYLSLAIKLVLFALVFALAVKNSDPVTLRFFLGREVETSLALALVAALCAGALFGVLAMTGFVLGLRREGSRARAEGTALRLERDALRVERDALGNELAALALPAPDSSDGASLAAASVPATDRQVPHGL